MNTALKIPMALLIAALPLTAFAETQTENTQVAKNAAVDQSMRDMQLSHSQVNVKPIRASEHIGMDVYNSADKQIGTIQDLVMDAGNNRISYAVLSFGGVMGVGDKYFAIPWSSIDHRDGVKDRVYLDISAAQLKGAPGFNKNKWPDTASVPFRKSVDTYYGVNTETRSNWYQRNDIQQLDERYERTSAGKNHKDQTMDRSDRTGRDVNTQNDPTASNIPGDKNYRNQTVDRTNNNRTDNNRTDSNRTDTNRAVNAQNDPAASNIPGDKNYRNQTVDRTNNNRTDSNRTDTNRTDRSNRAVNAQNDPTASRIPGDKNYRDKTVDHAGNTPANNTAADRMHRDANRAQANGNPQSQAGPREDGLIWSRRVSAVLGSDVRNSKNEDIGDIKDLIIEPRTGDVQYAVLSFGGTMGMGNKLFALPADRLQTGSMDQDLVLDVSKQTLKDAKGFDNNNWPDWSDADYKNNVNQAFKDLPSHSSRSMDRSNMNKSDKQMDRTGDHDANRNDRMNMDNKQKAQNKANQDKANQNKSKNANTDMDNQDDM